MHFVKCAETRICTGVPCEQALYLIIGTNIEHDRILEVKDFNPEMSSSFYVGWDGPSRGGGTA